MAGINISWDKIFARAVSTGVKKLGDVAETTDANIKAESKASAEAFAEANEKYTNEVQENKKALSKEVESISDLVGGDVGKIRTIMRTYGNADVVSQLQKDFQSYQANALRNTPGVSTTQDLKFKTLQEYINGRLTKTGTALVSDKAAEQASDEAAVAGDELDIQQAEKKAKNMGVSLEQYLNTQARKLSSRPAFSVEGKAARLVEESKVGAFGKTLTMEEAKKMVTGGQKLGGTEDETDLGDTGFALERDGGLSGEVIAKIMREKRELKEETGEVLDPAEKIKLRNDVARSLSKNPSFVVGDSVSGYDVINTKPALNAALAEIEVRLKSKNPPLSKKGINTYNSIKSEYEEKLRLLNAPNQKSQDEISKEQKLKNNNIEPITIKNTPKSKEELSSLLKQLEELKKKNHKFFLSPNNKLTSIDENINALKNQLNPQKQVIEKQPKSDKFVLPSQKEINKYPKG